ncbi:MAG TPA: MobF family relaxase [Rhodanobacteraceae bacterium]|nr:MobF family relaxase [Rhodanobacteraceae bacterium]
MTVSVTKLGNVGAAFSYYSERDDYYMSDHTSAEWYGAAAGRLGLKGDIKPQDFHDVLTGWYGDASVGQPDRHTPGWDITFSAPKSFSVAALVYKDERLIAVHDAAVRVTLDWAQQHGIVTRQRAPGGTYRWRSTGEMLSAIVRHSTSRNLDSQLHSHAVLANMTYDPLSARWLSVDSRAELYQMQRELGNIYANALAGGARRVGYTVDWTVDNKDNASCELREISQQERDLFSSRSMEGDAWLIAKGIDPKTASAKARQAATLATRSPKKHLPAKELHARWAAMARTAGFEPCIRPETAGASADAATRAAAARAAVTAAVAMLAERESRFTHRKLLTAAVTFAQGNASLPELDAAIGALHADGVLLDRDVQVRGHSGDLERVAGYTTEAAVATEKSMLDRANRIASRASNFQLTREEIAALIAEREVASGYPFTPEQREASEAILAGHGGSFTVLQGYAGTSKTTSILATVAAAARRADLRVRALAPTHHAADVLREAVGGESGTVASIIARPLEIGDAPELWIVDEAGMVSAEDMRALLERADQARAQVVLTGDVQQIGSIGAGSAFAQMQERMPDATRRLTDIKRQRVEALRAAVVASLHGDFDAALGNVDTREVQDRRAAVEQLADTYIREVHDGHQALVVTLSRVDRADVNAAVQDRRVALGEVSNVQKVATLEARQWTKAERCDASRYAPGDTIEVRRDYRNGPQRGELGTVEAVRDGRVSVRFEGGREWSFKPAKTKGVDVLERDQTKIGVGDRIVTKGGLDVTDASGEAVQLMGGTALTVERVDRGELTARLDDGRSVRINATRGAKVGLAYAETANQAQGRTADTSVAWMRSNQRNLADRQHAYVALSRARDRAVVVTDSKEKLARTLEKSSHGKEVAMDHSEVRRDVPQRTREPRRVGPEHEASTSPRNPQRAAEREVSHEAAPQHRERHTARHAREVARAAADASVRGISEPIRRAAAVEVRGVGRAVGTFATDSLRSSWRATAQWGRDMDGALRSRTIARFVGRATLATAKAAVRVTYGLGQAAVKAGWTVSRETIRAASMTAAAVGAAAARAAEAGARASHIGTGERIVDAIERGRAQSRARREAAQAKQDRTLLRKAPALAAKIERTSLGRQRDLARRFGVGMRNGGERAERGAKLVQGERARRDGALARLDAAFNRALERSSKREAQRSGVSLDRARARVSERTFVEQNFRTQVRVAQALAWMQGKRFRYATQDELRLPKAEQRRTAGPRGAKHTRGRHGPEMA